MIERLARAISTATTTAASLLKICIRSRRPSLAARRKPGSGIVILGNGPSLARTIADHSRWLHSMPMLAVNFAANTDEWRQLRPEFYVLVDPHFFDGAASDPNVERLWRNLASAGWSLILYVPADRAADARRLTQGADITIKTLNLTPVEGSKAICHAAFRMGLGMPRPRNVLIPSIMAAMREGFDTIYLAGADHSWTRTLSVDDENRVCTVQPHFYTDNDDERRRVATTYSDIRLHQMLESLTIAFRSYFSIADYARSCGCSIYNITPGSFIDAFPRMAPPEAPLPQTD